MLIRTLFARLWGSFARRAPKDESVRRLAHAKRLRAGRRPKPSAAFARYFGAKHGIELPRARYRFRPLTFSDDPER